MPIEITYEACIRYVQGKASLEEARAVRAWLADPKNELVAHYWMNLHAEALAVQEQQVDEEGPYDYAAMREGLHARMGLETSSRSASIQGSSWHRWAAAAALVGVSSAGWFMYERHQLLEPVTASYSSPYGHTQLVHLPDGSEVTLNAHSTLRYAATPGQRAPREVWLDGEAFFAVKHLPDNKRFVVHTTAGFQVEVLGTKFTVYRRHEQARVVLLSGKVRVAFADQKKAAVTLKPGELLQTFDTLSQTIVHRKVQATAYATWTADKMVFDATTITDVATRLEDTYGVEVIIKSAALNQRRFTGTFPMGNLDVLCENLSEAFHLQITRHQNQLVLSDNASSPSTL
ncbi:FecR family protein [Hymenobacter jejuensis]|uniref:DUF4974 domain-containing protein n=1 Tax=Hymenobacter jejuensis TaxID=2502781 RepID=A0A5B8A4K4_9BACT|nr:FecR domain-containing protein [Hymenobacter jejuensis]QDA61636.1 DUF4974 domain-containing protein [Hymenobacter jejuensis]